jgi:hypothetical protein
MRYRFHGREHRANAAIAMLIILAPSARIGQAKSSSHHDWNLFRMVIGQKRRVPSMKVGGAATFEEGASAR